MTAVVTTDAADLGQAFGDPTLNSQARKPREGLIIVREDTTRDSHS